MKVSLLKLLRRKEQRGGYRNSNYRIAVFSICVLISFAFWLMNTLSKKYTEPLVFYIEYQHLPEPGNRLRTTDTMRIKVITSGYRIMGYKLGLLDKIIKMDAAQFRHRDNQYIYTLGNHTHSEKIEEQLGDEVKVLDISPDTLYIRLVELQNPDKG
jgi:hypothetical protein